MIERIREYLYCLWFKREQKRVNAITDIRFELMGLRLLESYEVAGRIPDVEIIRLICISLPHLNPRKVRRLYSKKPVVLLDMLKAKRDAFRREADHALSQLINYGRRA